ncbi:MAG: radical SAM protein [Firmicutes bacterium]|nr:radical SAM protein [Bacillota bacterium]
MFLAVWANRYGEIEETKNHTALGRTGNSHVIMEPDALIPLPASSELHFLPGRTPLGTNRRSGKIEEIRIASGIYGKSEETSSVSAVLPPGYTRTYVPSFKNRQQATTLPFFAYTAVSYKLPRRKLQGSPSGKFVLRNELPERAGICHSEGIEESPYEILRDAQDDCGVFQSQNKDERLYVAAIRTEDNYRWDVSQFNSRDLDNKIKSILKAFPKNRILRHLSNCSRKYRCLTAQNIFYQRWEGGIPVSTRCNARCVGCISLQSSHLPPSPQSRIGFKAETEEVVEIAVPHLEAPDAIVSFGQGCEGEPTLLGDLLEKSIKKIRSKTSRGTININTNGSKTEVIARLAGAGLDSMRVSLNSAVPEHYKLYFRPVDYSFDDVKASIKTAREKGVFVSLNLLVMPGVTDNENELKALVEFARDCSVNMIQLRNLNIDPDLYFRMIKLPQGRSIGILNMIETFKKELPEVRIGNFTPALR